jgi:hypothetical protein
MFNTIVGAGAFGAGAASRYGSGQMMQLLAAPAPQHCIFETSLAHESGGPGVLIDEKLPVLRVKNLVTLPLNRN